MSGNQPEWVKDLSKKPLKVKMEFLWGKVSEAKKLINELAWRGVESGHFSFSMREQQEYWTYNDDCEYYIACSIGVMKSEISRIKR